MTATVDEPPEMTRFCGRGAHGMCREWIIEAGRDAASPCQCMCHLVNGPR